RAVGNAARLFPGQLDQFRRIARGKRRVRIQRHVEAREQHHAGQVLQCVVRELAAQERIDHVRAGDYSHRVAVGWRLRDRVGADSGVGAGLVLDDDRLLPALGQPLGHVARQRVGGAAGRERDDQPHYMVGESLRLRRCRCGTEQAGRQGQHGRRPYVHDWLERSHAGFLFWRGGYPAHWPRLVISTTPRSASTLTQSPVAMHSSGSRSKSVIDGAWLTTAPSAILVVISLNRKAAGATFIRRARWNAADQPEEPLAPGNTGTLPAKLW